VRVREENLARHARSAALAESIAGTLCYLALDSARAGDDAFDRYARRLLDRADPGDAVQSRYDAAAVLRGLVALGRDDEAIAWARDERRVHGARAPASLVHLATGDAPIATHPEISVARALARAYRRKGRVDDAIAVAERVPARDASGADLVGWLGGLAHLEAALARRDRGEDVRERLASIRASMRALHDGASRHHAHVLDAGADALAAAIDRVWY
jgi:hypothetical protein